MLLYNIFSDINDALAPEGNLTLFWEFPKSNKNNVIFMVKYNWESWFGLGFAASMTNTDMAIGNIINNSIVDLVDCYSTGQKVLIFHFY